MARRVVAVAAILSLACLAHDVRADYAGCDVALRAACGFGLDGEVLSKFNDAVGGSKHGMKMLERMCGEACSRAMHDDRCVAAGWSESMTDRILDRCDEVEAAKADAERRMAEKEKADAAEKDSRDKMTEAEKKRADGENCREQLARACGIGEDADPEVVIKKACTRACTNIVHGDHCKRAGITDKKLKRHLLCGEIDPKTRELKPDTPRPKLCQRGLKTICGVDGDILRFDPATFESGAHDKTKLCSAECVELTHSKHCQALGVHERLVPEDLCDRMACEDFEEEEGICQEDLCDPKCKLSTEPKCAATAAHLGIAEVDLLECAVKRGEMTQLELDARFPPGERFIEQCVKHDACHGDEDADGEEDRLCADECPLRTERCAYTRRAIGLDGRPMEVQCAAEEMGVMDCDALDDAVSDVLESCPGVAETTWRPDDDDDDEDDDDVKTRDACEAVFGYGASDDGRGNACAAAAREKLVGFTLKCILNGKKKVIKNNRIAYAREDEDEAAEAVANLFFFRCGGEGGEGGGGGDEDSNVAREPGVWRTAPRYVSPMDGARVFMGDDAEDDAGANVRAKIMNRHTEL